MRNFLLPLILAVALAGCDAFGDGSGSLRVLLTDAPGDFLTAQVTIDSVYLQGEGGAVVLMDEPVDVSLLELQNEVMDLVGETAVPAGTYSQLRLVISGGYIEVEQEDGSSAFYASSEAYAAEHGVTADGPLQMPSYGQSGLKVTLPGGAVDIDGDDQAILLDFNVAQSFGRQAGQSGRWVLSPVVHATDFALTGTAEVDLVLGEGVELPSVPGAEVLTLADFSAALDKDGEAIPAAFADEDGDGTYTATFRYLAPGPYDVALVGPAGLAFTADPAPLSITAESGTTVRGTIAVTDAWVEE